MALLIAISTTMQVSANDPKLGSTPGHNETAQGRITGVVKDKSGEALPGVTVMVKGQTAMGTATNVNGAYTLSGVPDNSILVFSFMGMETQEVNVAGKSEINITMNESSILLDEVVAIGYGVQRKSDLTGAVGSVKAEEFLKRPITRFEQALQGTTPGVQVISSSGQPGRGLSVKIRGANSITGGNEPLYVIDGNIGGSIDALNPSDIASVEILKDASATAIYGSRGTNGVVLITTKSGDEGPVRINFDTWFSKATLPGKIDRLTAAEFAETINNSYQAGAFTNAQIAELRSTGGTDWLDEISQKPWIQNYDLNVSGGSSNIKYRVSFNHLDHKGLIVNQFYKRTAVRTNLDIKVSERIDLKVNLSYLEPRSRNTGFSGDIYDPLMSSLLFDPTLPVYNENGEYNRASTWGTNGWSPVAQLNDRTSDNSSKNIVGTGILEYKITKWLKFTTNNTYSTGSNYNQSFSGPLTNDVTQAQASSTSRFSFQNSNFLTYDDTFGDHRITATLLYEHSRSESRNHSGTARNLSTIALTYWNLGLGATQTTSSGYSADAMESFMARVNYSYKNRYYLTAAIRRDGSSRLTDKYDNFPSVALAWNVANENFLINHPIISGLKIRATYGETGNQAVGSYSTIPDVATGGRYYFNGTTATNVMNLGTVKSQKLSWEHAKQIDVGLDLVLWNGKLTFTADYYNKDVVDLLYSFNAPLYMGGGSYSRNMGKLNNRGLEFAIGAMPVSKKDFSWNTLLTFSFNKNKVVDLAGEDDIQYSGIGSFGTNVSRLVVGRPLGEFYGYEFLGTWKTSEATEAAKYGNKPGDAKYSDLNGDFAINNDDRTVIGNGTPDVSFGFINDFKYKNFTLTFMFQGMAGNEIYSQTLGSMWGGHGMSRNATIKDALNMWTTQKETEIPTLGGTSVNYYNSSRFVYNGSFIKLKNLSFSYNVPNTALSKLFIHSLEVYVSGQNLFSITKYPGFDPEVNSATNAVTQGLEMGVIPNPRTYTLGLRLGF